MQPELTVLSFGGGQDSTAILLKMIYDADFRRQYAPANLVVVMSDTGDEHPATYKHVDRCRRLCEEHGIAFKLLHPTDGYHLDSWPSLRAFYERTNTVGSKAYPKTCTDNLKIRPIYFYLADYLAEHYGTRRPRHLAFQDFAAAHGRVRVLIGIAAGEETRVGDHAKNRLKWWRECLDIQYPLIDQGMDRAACQAYIDSIGQEVPPPSNCMLCPFVSEIELLWLYRHHRGDFEHWVRIEQRKLEANAHMGDKNLGVWGRPNFTLLDALALAEQQHGHLTDAELHEYKMSHGHCVASKH